MRQSACSSVDRAPASGAGRVGSSPARRIQILRAVNKWLQKQYVTERKRDLKGTCRCRWQKKSETVRQVPRFRSSGEVRAVRRRELCSRTALHRVLRRCSSLKYGSVFSLLVPCKTRVSPSLMRRAPAWHCPGRCEEKSHPSHLELTIRET